MISFHNLCDVFLAAMYYMFSHVICFHMEGKEGGGQKVCGEQRISNDSNKSLSKNFLNKVLQKK